jgi:hypothetical protein
MNNSSKTIFIITGAPNDRKSSTIRALTGVNNGKSFEVEINGSAEKVYVMTTSPNEVVSKSLPNGINSKDLVKLIKGIKDETKIILPIRAIKPLKGLPAADVYIKAFHDAGFELATIAMYNINVNLPKGVTGTLINNTRTVAANKLASMLRKLWNID